MKTFLTTVAALSFQTYAEATSDKQMSFVFELVRHGARAPIQDFKIEEFPVSEGMLTPSGMRQRHLIGHESRRKYMSEEANFLSGNYNPSEVFFQSTNVNRVITSMYSELMGLYPPSESGAAQLSDANLISLEDGPA